MPFNAARLAARFYMTQVVILETLKEDFFDCWAIAKNISEASEDADFFDRQVSFYAAMENSALKMLRTELSIADFAESALQHKDLP